jgi:hypothetical protein
MTRVVIRVNEDSAGPIKIALEEPLVAGGRTQRTFELDPTEDELLKKLAKGDIADGDVRLAGAALWNGIARYAEIGQALQGAIGSAAPVYIRLDTHRVESYPWEALYADQNNVGFVALHRNRVIGRIIDVGANDPMNSRIFEPPLRIMAVLGAYHIDAVPEWRRMHQAVQNARSHFSIELRAIVSATQVHEIINADEPGAWGGYVPIDITELFAEIREFNPHIIHLFCHGSVKFGAALQLATRNAEDGNRPDQCISIKAASLAEHLATNSSLWLVVLNSCSSAAAIEQGEGESVVGTLIAKGVPAGVGMRETVLASDAYLFTEKFYPSALDLIHQAITSGAPTVIDWCTALYKSRLQLCMQVANGQPPELAAERTKAWTLPVVYRRSQDFMVQVRAPAAQPALPPAVVRDLVDELRVLNRMRDQLAAANAPGPVLDDIDKRIGQIVSTLGPTPGEGDP